MPFVVWPRLPSIKAKGIDYLARIIFTPWTAGLFFFALASGLLSGGLRARITLPASLIIAALFGAAAASRFDSRERRLMAALFSASLLLQALPEIVHPSDYPFYQFAWRASLVILGWSFAFSLFLIPPGTSPPLPEQRPRKQLAALIIVSFIGLSAIHWMVRGRYGLILDEVVYLLQSALVVTPGFNRPLDQWMAPFFSIRNLTYMRDGRFYAQYTPGWPILLAAFHRLGLRWFAPVSLGVMAVVFTYLLGKRLRSPRVGLIAAMFLATNYWLVFLSSTYMSHVSGMALLVMAALLLIETEEHGSRGRPFLWVLVGLTFGMVALIRPLTGVTVSFSLWLWILVRGRMARQDYVRMTITLALAAAVPLGFLLYYNRVTTGSAFSTGYSLAQGNIGDFGFGVRGTLVHDELGTPRVISKNFTPLTAVLNLLLTLRDASLSFTPAFFFAPLVGLAIIYKLRFPWRSVMVFLFLPFAHFFFWFRDLRYYSELLPFVMLGIALITDDLALKNKNMARWAIAFLIAGSLLFTADAMWAERKWYAELRPYFTSIEDLQRQKGKLLVFVNDKTALSDIPVLFDVLAWFDVDGFPGDVIVARDLGGNNTQLVARWPDHYPILVVDEGIGTGWVHRPTLAPLHIQVGQTQIPLPSRGSALPGPGYSLVSPKGRYLLSQDSRRQGSAKQVRNLAMSRAASRNCVVRPSRVWFRTGVRL